MGSREISDPPADDVGTARPAFTPVGGEFRVADLEAAFRIHRLADQRQHARVLLIVSAILNTLFIASDWRFHGTPQFLIAIPARLVVIAIALICLALVHRVRTPRGLDRAMALWMGINTLAVGALVTSGSDIALFVTILLPGIYYLVVPASFRWTLAGGVSCSIVMLAGYSRFSLPTELGLVLATVMLNTVLMMVLAHSNRLRRLEWFAARSERKAREALLASQQTFETMFFASPVPLIMTDRDKGMIVRINDTATALLGADPRALGLNTLHSFYTDAGERERLLATIDRNGAITEAEVDVRRPDGEVRTVLARCAALDVPEGRMIMAGLIDISDRKEIERRLEWLASTDPLTGLRNRTSFLTAARMEMLRASRSGEPLSLLMIDLDHFKRINDGFGHQVGDQVLRSFADLCGSMLRKTEVTGRLGGEEFAILLPGTDLVHATRVAEALRAAVAELRVGDCEVPPKVTTSIGVASVAMDDKGLEAALGRADLALYTAKNGGRNRVICEAETGADPQLVRKPA